MRHRVGGVVLAWLLLNAPTPAAQVGYLWLFDDLNAQSDLVVIAALGPTRSVVPEVAAPGSIMVELRTEFTVLSVFKGAPAGPVITLRHYKADAARIRGGIANGPASLDFAGSRPPAEYLLFLARDADGRFFPTSGHTSPWDSIFSLRKGVDPGSVGR